MKYANGDSNFNLEFALMFVQMATSTQESQEKIVKTAQKDIIVIHVALTTLIKLLSV